MKPAAVLAGLVCSHPVDTARTRCGQPALYGFHTAGWPPARKAAVCPLHAIVVRTLHPVTRMWSLSPWPVTLRRATRAPHLRRRR